MPRLPPHMLRHSYIITLLGAEGDTVQEHAETVGSEGCDVSTRRKPEELTEQERQRLHQAHQRLRNASHALEALTVVEEVRGRWAANPVPPEVLKAAQEELYEAVQQLWRTQYELLSLSPPSGTDTETAGRQI